MDSIKRISDDTLITQLVAFTKERANTLKQMQKLKIKVLSKLNAHLLNDGKLPKYHEGDPYFVEIKKLDESSEESSEETRMVKENPTFDKKYYALLGIAKSKKGNSGLYNSRQLGMFADFQAVLEADEICLRDSQINLLRNAFNRFRDNYRSTTKAEIHQSSMIQELAKLERGFQACFSFFEDKEFLKRLLANQIPALLPPPELETRENSSWQTQTTRSATPPRTRSATVIDVSSHRRQRSNSQTLMPADLVLLSNGLIKKKRKFAAATLGPFPIKTE